MLYTFSSIHSFLCLSGSLIKCMPATHNAFFTSSDGETVEQQWLHFSFQDDSIYLVSHQITNLHQSALQSVQHTPSSVPGPHIEEPQEDTSERETDEDPCFKMHKIDIMCTE